MFLNQSSVSRVTTGTTAVQLFAPNGKAGLRIVFNESAGIMYVKYSTVSADGSTTDYTLQIPPNTGYELPGRGDKCWRGYVNATLASGSGFAQVTECY